ncbi:hypothetical protein ACFUTR_06690 [Streptomyces sp. NPDC057367]|uniref:hypothetical protein n=1 Tax=Streptomyces sp. NPDC057367 TaxID=3346108 RepID=UPI00362F51AE
MTAWSWAEIDGQGGSTTSDRRYADAMSRRMAPRSNPNDHSDHYAEKAKAREAERQEAEEYRNLRSVLREADTRYDALNAFRADDPEPFTTTPDADDFLERMAEHAEWVKRRDAYLQRAEGEELAARVARW